MTKVYTSVLDSVFGAVSIWPPSTPLLMLCIWTGLSNEVQEQSSQVSLLVFPGAATNPPSSLVITGSLVKAYCQSSLALAR